MRVGDFVTINNAGQIARSQAHLADGFVRQIDGKQQRVELTKMVTIEGFGYDRGSVLTFPWHDVPESLDRPTVEVWLDD